jgi:hypothetical protein
MSDAYVFDAEAIIAFLYDEPGHETVASLLDDVFDDDCRGTFPRRTRANRTI